MNSCKIRGIAGCEYILDTNMLIRKTDTYAYKITYILAIEKPHEPCELFLHNTHTHVTQVTAGNDVLLFFFLNNSSL